MWSGGLSKRPGRVSACAKRRLRRAYCSSRLTTGRAAQANLPPQPDIISTSFGHARRNIGVDGRVSSSLFCAIGLHDLTGHFLLAAANRRRCSVLAINDRKLAAFYWRHYNGSELRPIEILGDLIDVGCAPPTDFALIRSVAATLVR